MDATDLGLSGLEQQVYQYLRHVTRGDVVSMAAALGIDEYAAVIVVGQLVSLGLATIDDAGAVAASPHPRSAHQPERITDRDQVSLRIDEEISRCHVAEVRAAKASQRPRQPSEPVFVSTVFHLRRGIKFRTLVARHLIENEPVAAYFHALDKAGDTVRVTSDTLQTMTMLDRTCAFVPIQADDSSAGALLIRDSGTVAALVALFDRAWIGATDLHLAAGDRASALDRQILAAMQHTAKDEVAARQLGISIRTFRRHVADLMRRAGAENRFQLASTAKEKGWL